MGVSRLLSGIVHASLVIVCVPLLNEEYVGNEVILTIPQGGGLYILKEVTEIHLLPHFIKTLKIQHTLLNTLQDILPPKNIRNGRFLGNSFQHKIPIHNY